jgi:hypothetical protein
VNGPGHAGGRRETWREEQVRERRRRSRGWQPHEPGGIAASGFPIGKARREEPRLRRLEFPREPLLTALSDASVQRFPRVSSGATGLTSLAPPS